MAQKKLKPFVFIGTNREDPDEPFVTFVLATDEDDAADIALQHSDFDESEQDKILMGEEDDEYDGSVDSLGYQVFPIPASTKFIKAKKTVKKALPQKRLTSDNMYDIIGKNKLSPKLQKLTVKFRNTVTKKGNKSIYVDYVKANKIPKQLTSLSDIAAYVVLREAGKLLPHWEKK